MKKRVSILLLAALPILALAAGDSTGKPGTGGHQMSQGHDMAGMHRDKHPAVAGKPGDSAQVSRTIEVTMDDDLRFTPSNFRVNKGETVRFLLKNQGGLVHEVLIGTQDEFDTHATMMRLMPDMSHTASNVISLNAGQRGALVRQFSQPGTVDIACLQLGHREAGMAGKVAIN